MEWNGGMTNHGQASYVSVKEDELKLIQQETREVWARD